MLINFIKSLIICGMICCLGRGTCAAQSARQTVAAIRYTKSEDMRRYMNESVDPCENFYEYACGNWKTYHPFSATSPITNIFYTAASDKDRKLTQILMEDDKWSTSADKKVKIFYESCVNSVSSTKTIKERLESIADEFGIMPAMYEHVFDENTFDWEKTVGAIANTYDIKIILNYYVRPDSTNNSRNIMALLSPAFALGSPGMYFEAEHAAIRQSQKDIIARDLKTYLGLSEQVAVQTAVEIFDFEASLNRGVKFADATSFDDARTTVDVLQRKYSHGLDIKKFMNISFGSIPTSEVYVYQNDYLPNLINTVRRTPKREVANYIFYKLLKQFMIPAPAVKSQLLAGCLQQVIKYFSKNLDNMFYRKYNSKEMEEGFERMWQDIKSTFRNFLQSERFAWMSYATRATAVEKVQAMKMEILSYENHDFNKDFEHLKTFARDDFLANLRSLFMLHATKARSQYNEPPSVFNDKDNLSFSPVYIAEENRIRIPVGTMQPYHFYSDSYPSAINYGHIGFLIAHELIHGFDEDGSQYDQDGNARDWGDEISAENFWIRRQCFAHQYSQFIYNGRPLPEMEQQSENIADNGGISLSFEAYRRYHENAMRTEEKVDLESLQDFHFNSNRMFFISFAQTWCSDTHPKAAYFMSATDAHCPEEIRVKGALSNFEEFAQEFNCPRGSPMNPITRCKLY